MIWCGNGSTHRRVDRQERIEQVREADALSFRDQTEQCAIAVKGPRSTLGNKLKAGLIFAVQQLIANGAIRRLVGQLKRFGTEPLDTDDSDQAIRMHAPNGTAGLKVFKMHELQATRKSD